MRANHALDLQHQAGRASTTDAVQSSGASSTSSIFMLAEYRYASFPQARNVADGLFQFVREDMPAAANDDVLTASRDIDLPTGRICQVAGIEPSIMEQLGGLVGAAPVAARGGWTLEFQAPLLTFAEFVPGSIRHAYFVPRQSSPAANRLQGRRVVVASQLRAARPHEPVALEPVHPQSPTRRRKGETHRVFRQPVHRQDRFWAEPVAAETLDECAHRVRAHRLSAVERATPGGKIETLN